MTRNVPPERGDDGDVWGAATDDVPDAADVPVADGATDRCGGDRDGDRRRDARDDPGEDGRRGDRGGGAGRTTPAVGSLFDEARRLFDVVRERVVEPLRSDHADVLDHLSAAGEELLAAYRSAVSRHERRWTSPHERSERVDVDEDPDDACGSGRPGGRPRGRPADGERGEVVPVEEDDDDERQR